MEGEREGKGEKWGRDGEYIERKGREKEQNSIMDNRKERKENLDLDLGGEEIKLCFHV